jgi:hypothetical protein
VNFFFRPFPNRFELKFLSDNHDIDEKKRAVILFKLQHLIGIPSAMTSIVSN